MIQFRVAKKVLQHERQSKTNLPKYTDNGPGFSFSSFNFFSGFLACVRFLLLVWSQSR